MNNTRKVNWSALYGVESMGKNLDTCWVTTEVGYLKSANWDMLDKVSLRESMSA